MHYRDACLWRSSALGAAPLPLLPPSDPRALTPTECTLLGAVQPHEPPLDRQRRQRVLRTLLLWLVAAAAYPCAQNPNGLALVEAVTGAMCSMLASLALPCACWVALYKEEVPWAHAAAAVALALGAACAGAAFTVQDIIKLGTGA